jgi:predicted DNA-binding transcriptional regulator AlpA
MQPTLPTDCSSVKRNLISSDEFDRRLGSPHRSTRWRWGQTDPEFPKPVPGPGGALFWVEDEVDRYIARLIERRDRGELPATMISGRRLAKVRAKQRDKRQLDLINVALGRE